MMFSKKKNTPKNHTHEKTQKTQTKHSKQNSNERVVSSCLLAFSFSFAQNKKLQRHFQSGSSVSSSEFFFSCTFPCCFLVSASRIPGY